MRFIYLSSIFYVYITQVHMVKFSEFLLENYKLGTSTSYIDLLINAKPSIFVDLKTRCMFGNICLLLSSLSFDTDPLVIEMLKNDATIIKEEVSATYRKRIILSSSINRLRRLDEFELTQLDFSRESLIRDFYMTNNIIDSTRLSQIRFPSRIDSKDIFNFMLSVEYAIVYLEIFEIILISARKLFPEESNWEVLNRTHHLNIIIADDEYKCYDSLSLSNNINNLIKLLGSVTITANMSRMNMSIVKSNRFDCILENSWVVDNVRYFGKNIPILRSYEDFDVSWLFALVGHKFVLRSYLAEFLISKIHFFAEVYQRNIIYQVDILNDVTYQVTITQIEKSFAEDIIEKFKSYPIPENIKICLKFYCIIDISNVYLLKKSDETEEVPIKTNVVLLTCGHLLGLAALNEWIDNIAGKCFLCNKKVVYVSSFETDVYRFKDTSRV